MGALIPDRLHPLLARLGSNADGERLACLRQIDKRLADAGATWTDLADRIMAEPATAAPFAAEHNAGPTFLHTWADAVRWIARHPEWRPSERERVFVLDLGGVLSRPGAWPTQKQGRWIAAIVARLGGVLDIREGRWRHD